MDSKKIEVEEKIESTFRGDEPTSRNIIILVLEASFDEHLEPEIEGCSKFSNCSSFDISWNSGELKDTHVTQDLPKGSLEMSKENDENFPFCDEATSFQCKQKLNIFGKSCHQAGKRFSRFPLTFVNSTFSLRRAKKFSMDDFFYAGASVECIRKFFLLFFFSFHSQRDGMYEYEMRRFTRKMEIFSCPKPPFMFLSANSKIKLLKM